MSDLTSWQNECSLAMGKAYSFMGVRVTDFSPPELINHMIARITEAEIEVEEQQSLLDDPHWVWVD